MNEFKVKKGLIVIGDAEVTGAIKDSSSSSGSTGDILSSTGSGTTWASFADLGGVTGLGVSNYLTKWDSSTDLGTSVIYDNGTNVGIGTNSPTERLSVQGTLGVTGRINGGEELRIGSGEWIRFGIKPTLWADSTNVTLRGGSGSDAFVYHDVNGVEQLRIDNNGNVGIGTTTPSAKLHVEGGDFRVEGSSFDMVFTRSDNRLEVENIETTKITGPSHGQSSNLDLTLEGNQGINYNTVNGNNGQHIFSLTGDLTVAYNDSVKYFHRISRTWTSIVGSGNLTTVDSAINSSHNHTNTSGDSTWVGLLIAPTLVNTIDHRAIQIDAGRIHFNKITSGDQLRFEKQAGASTGDIFNQSYYINTSSTPDFLGMTQFRFSGGVNDSHKRFNIFVADIVNPAMSITGGGNVGIGTSSPTYKLDVNGSSRISGEFIVEGDGTTSHIKSDNLRVSDAVNGAFGTLTLGSVNNLNGDVGAYYFKNGTTTTLSISNNGVITTTNNLISNGSITIRTDADNAINIYAEGVNDWGYINYYGIDNVRNAYHGVNQFGDTVFNSQNNDIYLQPGSGITRVQGNFRIDGSLSDSSNNTGSNTDVLTSTATGTSWVNINQIGGVDGSGTTNYITKWSDSDTITDSVIYDDGTNVGIGTNSPQELLHVDGDMRFDSFLYRGTNRIIGTSSSNEFLELSLAGGITRVHIDSSSDSYLNGGNVGIGTTTPSEKLHVDGSVKIENGTLLLNNGDNSVYIGDGVGLNDDKTNNYNVGIGLSALQENISGTGNIAVGRNALSDIVTGNENVAIGAYAGNSLNSGYTGTVAIGSGSLQNSSSGQRNTAVGYLTLQNNVTGDDNVVMGYNAQLNNSVSDVVIIGYGAGQNNTSTGSVGIGYQALENNAGNFNIGIGYQALENNTGTSQAIGIGYLALRSNTGNAVIGIGPNSLKDNTGDNSTGIGRDTLSNNSGNNNVAIGFQALVNNFSNDNSAFGYRAGYSLNTLAGANNTFLGANSTFSNSGITNSTAVGANITLTDSNTVILGNGADVGVGTTSPETKLHVDGDITLGSNIYSTTDGNRNTFFQFNGDEMRMIIGNSSNFTINDNGVVVNPTGRVNADFRVESVTNTHMLFIDSSADNIGVNQSSPNSLLHITGIDNLGSTTSLLVENSSGNSILKVNNEQFAGGTAGHSSVVIGEDTGERVFLAVKAYGGGYPLAKFIGTQVSSQFNTDGSFQSGSYVQAAASSAGGFRFNGGVGQIYYSGVNTGIRYQGGGNYFHHFENLNGSSYTNADWQLMKLSGNWSVDSASNDWADLNIVGTINQTNSTGIVRGIYLNKTLTSVNEYRAIEMNNSEGFGIYESGGAVNYFAGNVGVGTSSPSRKLHISTNTNDTTMSTLISNDNVGGRAGISFSLPNINNEIYSVGVDENRNFIISNSSSLATNPRLRLNPSGNFAINGTPNNNYSLLIGDDLGQGVIAVKRNGVGMYTELGHGFVGTTGSDGFSIKTTNIARIVVADNGNITHNNYTYFTDSIRVAGAFNDSTNSAGVNGNILSSTATGTTWIDFNDLGIVDGSGLSTQVTFWSDTDTVTGSDNFTWDGSTLNVNGVLEAVEKSFVIDHPTKEGMQLVHGVVEGPEHSVFYRGRLENSNVIELPEYWTGLVDESTITVHLTAIGKDQDLIVDKVEDNKVFIKNTKLLSSKVNCFYYIMGTRKDVEPLITEREKKKR